MQTANVHRFCSSLWGVVLAGGEGGGLASLVRTLRGDFLPKQFVNFIGRRSMLQHTIDRAEKLISRERLLVVVKRAHLKYPEARGQLARRVKNSVIVQPDDKGTAPAVLLSLLHIYRRDPLATVAVFPSDHFVLEEDRLVNYLYLATRTVERDPSSVVVLGAQPNEPDEEYNYILPGEETDRSRGLGARRVTSFIAEPGPQEPRRLVERGALWNTAIVVFKAFTLFDLAALVAPSLHAVFERIGETIGTRRERWAVTEAFRQIEPLNFSRGLLEPLSRTTGGLLLTLPVEKVLWSEWQSPHRVVSVLTKTGYLGRAPGISARRLLMLWANNKKPRKTRKPIRERGAAILQMR
ncbi:MAG TPA: sugar phosphate nucleotidyltransferase [Candidatus Binatia bacterium]|jgi:mannose-1-phosphate guanylyltransferase